MAELNDELNDEELFNSAIGDDLPEVVETTEPEADTRVRDEQGRFAKSEEVEAKPEVKQEINPAEPKEVAESPGVRQLREAFERSERRAADLERRLFASQPKPEPVAKPDIFEKPDEFVRANIHEVVAPLQHQFSTFIESVSRRDAIKDHGQERVTQAYSALDQAAKAGDPQALAVVQAVKASMDPYGDIVGWYAGAEASRDPDAFFQRKLDEALKDEKFKGELLTKLQPPPEQPPAKPVFKLPPSLNRVASAAPASDGGGDLSNESLFAHATR